MEDWPSSMVRYWLGCGFLQGVFVQWPTSTPSTSFSSGVRMNIFGSPRSGEDRCIWRPCSDG